MHGAHTQAVALTVIGIIAFCFLLSIFLKEIQVAKMQEAHTQAVARTVIGIIGNFISGCMFLAPLPTFKRIINRQSSEEFHPYPYLATCMNCMFWIFYGSPIVHPDSFFVITINGFGLSLELLYLSIFFFYTTNKNRRIILLSLLGEAALLSIIANIALLCFHTHAVRSMFVGIICVVSGIIMYGSPLSILRKVIKTKSAEFLPFWLCLFGLLNGIVWFIYANLKKFDPYLATSNGIGALLGLIQLSVYTYYTTRGKQGNGPLMPFAFRTSANLRGRAEIRCSICNRMGHYSELCYERIGYPEWWGDRPHSIPNVVCSNCHRVGHDSQSCFDIIGYPEWWGDRPRRGLGRARKKELKED